MPKIDPDTLTDENSTLVTVGIRVVGDLSPSEAEDQIAEALDYWNCKVSGDTQIFMV